MRLNKLTFYFLSFCLFGHKRKRYKCCIIFFRLRTTGKNDGTLSPPYWWGSDSRADIATTLPLRKLAGGINSLKKTTKSTFLPWVLVCCHVSRGQRLFSDELFRVLKTINLNTMLIHHTIDFFVAITDSHMSKKDRCMYEFLAFHYGKLISVETFLYDISDRLPFAPLGWATIFSALSFFPLALCLVYTPSSLPSCLIFLLLFSSLVWLA